MRFRYRVCCTVSRWERLDGEHTLGEVRDAVVEEFEVEPEVAEADLLELVAQLVAMGALGAV